MSAEPRQSYKSSVWFAILLIVLGILAISLPALASIGVARVLSWLILFEGIIQLVYAFKSEGVGSKIWKLLVSVLYIFVGGYLLVHPLIGLAGLTLMLAVFFFIEGITDIGTFIWSRKSVGSEWLLLHGIVTLLLGVMIWKHWPVSSLWALGTLVGISMLLTGLTRLMMGLKGRRLVDSPA
ncbi:uncharacterized membrane protein HdeD (DUF308 family) [Edaphobacter aggregans]|jgi:uncharacterized membrane protein HdeD (DUF308 family)|uniref:Uncharacterized membrane protein HdeD (DUF308 family) n=1 Tax=Edaphobacter aggregans TaxID=570835 RepID=A0A428MES3_9BACT|nr:DUF308 domain-containing protein [Edaphobacter aggregans]RSL15405.1 uncharacterized membrane protein HdeD (DUF308 family) [Edaphobacter aggregans]